MPGGRRGRAASAERAIRAFQRLDFELDHVTGSHYYLRHPDGRRATIPRLRVVKPGLLLDQVKKAGIDWDEFADNL